MVAVSKKYFSVNSFGNKYKEVNYKNKYNNIIIKRNKDRNNGMECRNKELLTKRFSLEWPTFD